MKTKRKGMSYAKWGYIFLAPFFITFFIFQFWPLATTIYYSFFEYFRSGLKIIGPNFVGLKNYAAMIQEVPKYFSNTMIMWLMGFIPQIIVSLVLAAWFTDLRLKLRFQGFFKTVIYMPNLICFQTRRQGRSTRSCSSSASWPSRCAGFPMSGQRAVWLG